jgi:hypothetical protein
VAKPGAKTKLENRLRKMGFKDVRRLPGTQSILIVAPPEQLKRSLNIELEWKVLHRTLVSSPVESRYPEISDSSRLPKAISELIESFYTPPPPSNLWSGETSPNQNPGQKKR